MKIYVVKDMPENITVAYTLTFKRAKKLAKKFYIKNWIIEERPIGRWLDPRDRREAWSSDMMMGDRFVPAGTLVGPYDGYVYMTRMRRMRKIM